MITVKKLILMLLLMGMMLISGNAFAEVYNGYWHGKNEFNATYPIVDIADKDIRAKINDSIQNTVQSYSDKVDNEDLESSEMTYYTKYEDKNIVNFMFYVNQKDLEGNDKLSGFTVTYDKHTGEIVPESRYLIITLAQLQDALDHSKAYAVDGLDNGVNLQRKIPYVSNNYFIVTDGSIGLLYQPGDLMDAGEGATKIIIAPEKVKETYDLNNK